MYTEDVSSRSLQNVGIKLPNYTVSETVILLHLWVLENLAVFFSRGNIYIELLFILCYQ
jgi:hypothetical protein